MSNPLLSDSEMASLREVGLQGMQTSCAVWPRTTVKNDDGQSSTWVYASTVLGWLSSTPTPMQIEMSGKIVTVNTYLLYLPVGTAVVPGDHVVIGPATYTVSDTTVESTWQPWLRVSMRYTE
jgi:hypothetical protein